MLQLEEKPQNGLKGLRHWRHDLLAGLQVSLVSLPLSLGIAIASGAPPITGVVSAIIAGLIFPFLGGAYVTISGPAAGLAPALLAGMLTLGNGDLSVGYPLLLVAICLVGVVQVVLCLFRAGDFARMLPIAVVEGMLASIGLMIIIKQMPAILGDLSGPSKTILSAIGKIPYNLSQLNPTIFMIGTVSFVLIFYLNKTQPRWLKYLPPPLFVVMVGIALGTLLQIDPKYLIRIPDNILKGGLTLPAFGAVWERQDLWFSITLIVITLTLIDGIESLATITAVDKIDPFQRRSHPNRTLMAMGVSNTLSSLAGGLTIIPGGIKSRANIDAGGRTLWANAYNAMFLIIFLFAGKALINRIPLATLAAVLIYVGWRLCEPSIWRKMRTIGREQLFLFTVTVTTTLLLTDLLVGILVGVLAKGLLLLYMVTPSLRLVFTGQLVPRQFLQLVLASLGAFFKNPIIRTKTLSENGEMSYNVYLSTSVCFNLLKLEKALAQIPRQANLNLVFAQSARIVDHTTMEHLHYIQEQRIHDGRKCEIRGLESFHRFSNHSLSAGLHDTRLHMEKAKLSTRQQQMLEFAENYGFNFSPTIVSPLNEHNFIYFSRGSDKQESNIMSGSYKRCEVKIFDYGYRVLPGFYEEERHTVIIIKLKHSGVRFPNCVLEPDRHHLDHYLMEYREVHLPDFPRFAECYHLHAEDEAAVRAVFVPQLVGFLESHPHYFLEMRDGLIMAFRADKELEDVTSLHALLALADLVDELFGSEHRGAHA